MDNKTRIESPLQERMVSWASRYGVPLAYLSETTSTNLAAREKEYPNGAVILAESQTAGRGQRGNRWLSAPGENLTFSVVLRPDFLPAGAQFYLSKAVSLALTDTLEELLSEAVASVPMPFGGFSSDSAQTAQTSETEGADVSLSELSGKRSGRVYIKWPNDIYVEDRKIVGILIENDLSGATFARSIVGIGINVNQIRFPAELPNPTSLALETGTVWELTEVFGTFYRRLSRRYDQLGRGALEEIDRDYRSKIYRLGVESRFAEGSGGAPFWGTITGVLPGGELEVRHRSDGRIRQYLFKEIEYLLA